MTRFTAVALLAFCFLALIAAQQQSMEQHDLILHETAPTPMHAKKQHEEGARAKGTLGILDALEDPRNGAKPGEPTS